MATAADAPAPPVTAPLSEVRNVGHEFRLPNGTPLCVLEDINLAIGANEVVECLNAGTGASIWKYPYPCDYEDDFNKGNGPRATPVLADGLFVHSTRPTGPADPFEADVELPNINCRKCTLQVVQFMADHGFNNPGGYSYHHCAELQITADRAKPIDTRWPAER